MAEPGVVKHLLWVVMGEEGILVESLVQQFTHCAQHYVGDAAGYVL